MRNRGVGYDLLIRGPWGIGKTTIARSLATKIAQVISIDQILEENDLWRTGRLSEFLEANSRAVDPARRRLKRGTPIIFDGNFYWKSQVEDLVRRLAFRHIVFTLKAPLWVCIERDSRRDRPQGVQGCREVYAKSTRFEYGIGVDATRPIGSIVGEITSHLTTTSSTTPR